jgi:AcrR family transcriptional regulator
MPVTPWGRSERLRSRQLPPGPRTDKQSVERNQRERLFAATVAVVAEKGYEATTVGDLIELAGVSRSAFYRHFSNKLECFLATLDALLEMAGPAVLDVYYETGGTWDRRLGAMLQTLVAMVVAQPAAARVAWVELYAAGPEAVERVELLDARVERIVRTALRESPEHAGAPQEVVHAVIGGLRKIVHARLREDREGELPDLMPQLLEWMLSYRTPPEPLRRPHEPPPELAVERPPARDPRGRILYAVTDLVSTIGYPGVTITRIADQAGVSLTTFYNHFDGKEEAFLATLAEAQQRVLEATLQAYRAAGDWPEAISAAARAFLGYLATDPTTAHLGGVDVWATGPAAFQLRAQALGGFVALLEEGYRLYPATPPIAGEAIGASVDALLFDHMRRGGERSLYELVPTVAFVTFAPFMGSERACELANAAAAAVPAASSAQPL